jgi:excisionase family DNA binding protein
METVTARDVGKAELDQLANAVAALPASSPFAAALSAMCDSVRAGEDVVVTRRTGHDVTPAQAAAVLAMSRTHLYKVMDRGGLPFVRVGRDRRISFEDLIAFQARREQDRKDLAERFGHADVTRSAALAENLGLSLGEVQRLGY